MKIGAHILAAGALWAATDLRAASVSMIEIRGAIGPAVASYISRAVDLAAKRNDACLIIQLDTPGGLLDSTREITAKFSASHVPIVVYVAPNGAMATSAGCYITLAADIAAMSPGTTIGAAHVVTMGGGGETKVDDVMKQKMENVGASYIENLAKQHHRNVEWARSAARESVSVTAEDALGLNVIDLIAKDVPDLLKQLDGRTVGDKTLATAKADIFEIRMTGPEKFLQLFLRPEMMFVLMLMVMYGIIGELSNPGAILPGIAGAIALILVLCMSAILPINLAGLALIGLAALLFIIDVFAPTHGVLTFGGIVSFFLGALMLFDRNDAAFRLSLAYIIPATLLTAGFFIFVVGAGLRAQRLPVQVGRETMLGKVVPALERIDASGGRVFIEGELWNAVSEVAVEKNQPVEIVTMEGLTLKVKPKQG